MAVFPVPCGPFAGMTQAQLQALLVQAQTAYSQLMMGTKGVTFSYAQGDGTKAVTYQATSVSNITAFMMQIQQALGMCCGRRRPLYPVYGP